MMQFHAIFLINTQTFEYNFYIFFTFELDRSVPAGYTILKITRTLL